MTLRWLTPWTAYSAAAEPVMGQLLRHSPAWECRLTGSAEEWKSLEAPTAKVAAESFCGERALTLTALVEVQARGALQAQEFLVEPVLSQVYAAIPMSQLEVSPR